ncbi:MAG: flgB [Hydrocarboniphaga sp.]|uniref:flagellar basal body rod protein FlgB n=1 Tax=Hydrocarboniphaga sp. TaxID=2033016 RepID=UPI00262E21C3|nr:flagellar basal body rod protein FlgB [Hydrocarboniphaga sp.]MDB5967597.1 flgB [Hydrocarboniphaga sp.]
MALDPLFGLHADALAVQRKRMDVLAGNLANSDTPNFKARDVDFAATLQQALGQSTSAGGRLEMAATRSGTSLATGTVSGESIPGLVWRVPTQNSVDGNTVDAQIEQAKFADAALHYQASLNFVDGRVKGMLTAITGQ